MYWEILTNISTRKLTSETRQREVAMNSFKTNCLSNISTIINGIPADTFLYGKCETAISSALASSGNSTHISPVNSYYRTEKNKIDISRTTNGKIDFALEHKYLYVSDLNEKIKIAKKHSNVFKQYIGKSINYVDFTLCNSMRQLNEYTKNTNCNGNYLVLLTMVFAPYKTNNFLSNNSGLKYFTPKRISFDNSFFSNKCSGKITNIINAIDNEIKNLPVIKNLYHTPNLYDSHLTKLQSQHGFNYYIVTLAYN